MNRANTLLTSAATLIAAAGSISLSAQPLPTDDRLVTGELENGMHYIVRAHSNPPGRAVMWIHVSTGSLNETDQQRGIAHFLEHMAFNGSENFPPGSVIPFFQGMGLTFGQHQNAFTSFDQTTYQLSFPDVKPETLEKGMRFFGDIAGRLSLLPKEIDSERQVILEEKRARLGPQQRVQEFVLSRLMPGSIVGDRLPIGTEETLLKVSQQDFKDYYGKWYTPTNMTLMVVADTDPKVVVEKIKEAFGVGEKTPRPVDNDPGVKPYTQTRAIVATDKELTDGEISMVSVGEKIPPATTVPLFRADMVRAVATSAFNRRMGAKLAAGGTSYLDVSASASNMFNVAAVRQAEVSGKPEDWKAMLAELGTDVQRARLHGFSQQEVDDVKKQILSGIEQFVTQESSIPAQRLIQMMNRTIAEGEPLMSAQQELDLTRQVLPGITIEEVSKSFADLFDPAKVTFIAQLPADKPGVEIPTESQLVELGQAAFNAKPDKQVDAERPSTLMTELPTPGKAVDVSTHEASGVTSGWFENGARFHHRFMDIRKDSVTISISLAGGTLQETAASRGVSDAAALAWSRPATSKLTSTNIRDIRTGKKAGARGGISTDQLTINASGSPSDIEDALQLAYLMLTDPVIEPAAFEQWKKETLQSIEDRNKNPQGIMMQVMAETLYPADEARCQLLTAEQVNRITIDAAQSWLRNAIASAPIEVSVVGDLPKERAQELLARYVGSLPRREKISSGTLDDLRTLKRTPGPRTTDRKVALQTPLAIGVNGFFGADIENVYDCRCLQLASLVLRTRILNKIREAEQLAYSPGCGHRPATDYPGFGVFIGTAPTEPGKVDRLIEAYDEIYAGFARDGATEEEMTTIRKQVANQMDEQMKDPGYWTARLSVMDYRKVNLDDVVGGPAALQAITADELKTVFNKYYKPENVLKIIIRPEIAAAPADAPAGKVIRPGNGS